MVRSGVCRDAERGPPALREPARLRGGLQSLRRRPASQSTGLPRRLHGRDQKPPLPGRTDGLPVDLTPEQEEVATFYAVMLDTGGVGRDGGEGCRDACLCNIQACWGCTESARTRATGAAEYMEKEQFKKNFWEGFSDVLGPRHVIRGLDKCDFRPIYDWHMAQRELKKALPKEVRPGWDGLAAGPRVGRAEQGVRTGERRRCNSIQRVRDLPHVSWLSSGNGPHFPPPPPPCLHRRRCG